MSRSQNQTKPEPIPSSVEAETETPGAAHPQAPAGKAPRRDGDVGDAATVPATSDEAAPGTSEELPVVQGIHTPEVRSTT